MRLDVSIDIAAPRASVWQTLVSWERQSEWMLDARSVEVITPHREGAGVTINVPTNLMGATVLDVMRVTRWEEQEVLEVIHLGKVIKGTGAFVLRDAGPDGRHTTVTWWEEIDPPLGAFGAWGAETFVAPFTRWLFAKSLRNLAMVCERDAAGSTTPLALA